jgi:ABC-type sugar transport system substrate-binding protein
LGNGVKFAGRCWALVLLLLLSSGCGTNSGESGATNSAARSGTGSGAKPLKIGMMPKLMGISFFDATGRGAKEAAQELGVDLTYDGPTEDNVEQQAEMLNTWIAQGFDVIAVAPNDPDSIASTLKDARDAGCTVLTWDTDANPQKSQRQLFVNHTPNEGIANTLIDMMVDGAADEDGKLRGKFVIISGTTTAANQNVWMDLMIPRLREEHPQCELLETLYPTENERKARTQTADLLENQPDLQGIWAITSVALPAAAKAVQDAGRSGQVCVTGLSMPSLMRDYVKNDTVKKFALFNVDDLGYLTVYMAQLLAEGKVTDGTLDVGRLRGVTINGQQVILGQPLVFDKANIDDFHF